MFRSFLRQHLDFSYRKMTESRCWRRLVRRLLSLLNPRRRRRWSVTAAQPEVWVAEYDHYVESVQLVQCRRLRDADQATASDGRPPSQHAQYHEIRGGGENSAATVPSPPPTAPRPAFDPDPAAHQSTHRRPEAPLPPPEEVAASRIKPPDGRLKVLMEELAYLSHQGWYWGPLTMEQTQNVLANLPDGSYLVRDSHNHSFLFALGFRTDGRTVCHFILL